MDNSCLGGDLKISIQGSSNVSICQRSTPVNKDSDQIVLYSVSSEENILKYDGTVKISGEAVTLTDDGDISVGKNIFHQSSKASSIIVNGLLVISIVFLLFSL